jgi:hypothetical protein
LFRKKKVDNVEPRQNRTDSASFALFEIADGTAAIFFNV